VRDAYRCAAENAGPATSGGSTPTVRYRSVLRRPTVLALTALVVGNGLVTAVFVGWLLQPDHIPGPGLARVCFGLVILGEAIKICQNAVIWLLVYWARDPVPLHPLPGMRIAVLTTIVASSEPVALVERTLRAMRRLCYAGRVDVWILDEEDSPEVRAVAARLGVRHFTRKGRPEFNRPSGPLRARTKAGNHNAWRAEHEWRYDVVCQMDPDHVPFPSFLERTLGYFRDPDTAFVVGPQVYGNIDETFVSRGASVQQYMFSGIVERAGNGLGAPLLIGTNHLYRPAAWRQIGGYQDSVTEDHLTGMRVLGTTNPGTGNRWRGVYTPDVLAVGEGPTGWAGYFNQQKRWAYGIWQIRLSRSMRAGIELSARQRILFGIVGFYYPSVAAHLVLGLLSTAGYVLLGATPAQVDGRVWLALWASTVVSWFVLWLWLRRFNLAPHERRDLGLHGIVLTLLAGPVYVAAAVAAVLRRPLTYVVTPKGGRRAATTPGTFRPHAILAVAAAVLLGYSVLTGGDHPALQIWTGLALGVGLTPLVASGIARSAGTAALSRCSRLGGPRAPRGPGDGPAGCPEARGDRGAGR
jgi:cellulose synthase/poly-beta-1,6-N-acetylglucosamine synthase-like glycosyltransferase